MTTRAAQKPKFGVLTGKLHPVLRSDCEALAGKSTLNRLDQHTPKRHAAKYHRIDCDGPQFNGLMVELFLEANERAPRERVSERDRDRDSADGAHEGQFFHGYYDAYCYLPLYVFCGRHLLLARQRRAFFFFFFFFFFFLIGQIRQTWPRRLRASFFAVTAASPTSR